VHHERWVKKVKPTRCN